ncbi:MAG TPA: chloramphenicol acetyltransferase [bacterium]
MSTFLDIENWNRREHFCFFKEYDNPFFNICADVDVTNLLTYTKEHHLSFFITSLFLSQRAANSIDEFRYRIRGDRVVVHDVIHAGSTVLNSDQTFSFCYFDYDGNFQTFNREATQKLAKYEKGSRSFEAREDRDDLIHYSVIPWIAFTSFSHARKYGINDSVPKVVFGKYYENSGIKKMPVSVEVHHALMDGIHVGRFFEEFQKELLTPNKLIQ